jgi:amino acid adenylation domain-containing protein
MKATWPKNMDVLAKVFDHASTRPAALAASDEDEALTFDALAGQAASVASGLRRLGVEPDDRVVVHLPNSVSWLTVALGCMWVGAAFVPLPSDDPPSRLRGIVQDCAPKLAVTTDPVRAPWPDTGIPTVDVTALRGLSGEVPTRVNAADRDAYLIYTSGTSGSPKGVRIGRQAFGSAVASCAECLGFDHSTRTLIVSAFHFDGSYGNLFPTLVSGGAVFIPDREKLIFVRRFFRALLHDGITHVGCSPSYLRMVLSSPEARALRDSHLRTMGLGGEECTVEDLRRLWAVMPQIRVFNRYGPTETTMEVTTQEIDPRWVKAGRVPIGTPHPGVSFYLLDQNTRVISEPNEPGELYIGGRQLMRSYWGDDSLTAEVLRVDVIAGQTVYKTGDLVYRDEVGQYVYVGRCDDVVKRSGVRISLQEVARVVSCFEGVTSAMCATTDIDGRLGIAAFVEGGPGLTADDVLSNAEEHLPLNMLPDQIFVVDSIPMNSSGKADRSALLEAVGCAPWRGFS